MTPVPIGAPRGRSRWTFRHRGRDYAVLELDGGYVVIDARCPHRDGNLAEGAVRDGAVVCPSHLYAFDLHTGACRTASRYALRRYDVIEQDGVLVADLPRARRWPWAWPLWSTSN